MYVVCLCVCVCADDGDDGVKLSGFQLSGLDGRLRWWLVAADQRPAEMNVGKSEETICFLRSLPNSAIANHPSIYPSFRRRWSFVPHPNKENLDPTQLGSLDQVQKVCHSKHTVGKLSPGKKSLKSLSSTSGDVWPPLVGCKQAAGPAPKRPVIAPLPEASNNSIIVHHQHLLLYDRRRRQRRRRERNR